MSVAKTREPASRRPFDFADIASHGLDEHHFTDTLQDDIATAVDTALSARLTGTGRESRARSGGTQSVAAFDAYLRGKDLFDSQRDEASDRGSLEAFSDAVQLDPDYAAARAARSRALAVIANEYAQAADRRPLYSQAVSEDRRAVSSAPQFAEAHAALGCGGSLRSLPSVGCRRGAAAR